MEIFFGTFLAVGIISGFAVYKMITEGCSKSDNDEIINIFPENQNIQEPPPRYSESDN